MFAAAMLAACAHAENPGRAPSEYQVKAAFLYNFAKFVEWPGLSDDQKSPLDICVLGKDPFGPELDRVMDGKTVNGRSISVQRFSDVSKAQSCHVLFVGFSDAGHVAETAKALRGRNILTVGETEGFCESGGVIAFVMDGQRVRFRINPKAAARANLKISSKLLQLAVATPEDDLKD